MDKGPNNNSGSLIGWFAQNHVAANILMLLFVIGGILSVSTMRTETFPSIDPRLISVVVPFPGATPHEVEDGITSRVEEALIGIEGVKRVVATAQEGVGKINAELEDFADSTQVFNDVETEVNRLSDFPPEDAEQPTVTKVKVTPQVIRLALYGDVEEEVLRYWAETIEEELRAETGVSLISIGGIRNYEISVEVSEASLRRFNLSIEDVANAVRQFSRDTPAGTLEAENGDILLRIQEKRFTGPEFENIVIRTRADGSVLRLKDIGRVIDGFEDSNLISRFNGERSAFISISRSVTEDTLSTAEKVKEYLSTVQLPTGLTFSLVDDETERLRERISLMLRNAILGFALVFVILLLFLDLKLAFWTSAAIPISFLGGMMIVGFMGYSVNMISLFALIVVLGIVVDDAIIAGESVFEAQRNSPDDPKSLMNGVRAVIAPVTIGVSTTIAAFAPLAFSTGTLGQIIQVIPIVVIAVLVVSLIEAFFILPAHLSNPKRWSRGILSDARDYVTKNLNYFIEQMLEPAAKFCLKWRYATLSCFVGFVFITAGLFQGGFVRFVFFPQIEGDNISITLTMPQGTPFDTTEGHMRTIQTAVEDVRAEIMDETNPSVDIIRNFVITIGEAAPDGGGPGSANGASTGNHLGKIDVRLIPSGERPYSAKQIENRIREKIGEIPNVDKLEFQSSPIGDEADINIELSHRDEDILNEAADRLKEIMKETEGLVEVSDSFEPGKIEYLFYISPEGLAAGVTPELLGRQLRGLFFGIEAQRIQRDGSEVIVYVRYPKQERESLEALNDARIRLPDGREASLKTMANIQEVRGFSKIESVNGQRIVAVTADVDNSITTPTDATEYLNQNVLPDLLNQYVGLSYSYEGQSRDQAEDLQSLLRNMMIAVLIIFVLLGALLRSYTQPFIIIAAIPFGVVGAIWGHFLLGYDLSFISMFGIVALSGVVVNDSVVLIDYYNRKVEEGMSHMEAALLAIKRRFRPILLTTLTTSLGLFPMLMETSLQARFLIPMVISLAAGIIFATVIIMLLVPILIIIVEDIRDIVIRGFQKLTGQGLTQR